MLPDRKRRLLLSGPILAAAWAVLASTAAADNYQLIAYTPLTVDEVAGNAGCPEVTASGKRVRATCRDGGELDLTVNVPQVREGPLECLVTLRQGDGEGPEFIGVDRNRYESAERFERCRTNVTVRPGHRYRGRLQMHVTKSGW